MDYIESIGSIGFKDYIESTDSTRITRFYRSV